MREDTVEAEEMVMLLAVAVEAIREAVEAATMLAGMREAEEVYQI
jgi:hypothetical protein